ncbi:MAG: DUF4160 domain-containing protein [Rickettsiales bacterium]|nr:DUF4160 domain-containing protein [Rickettsiales bacterium]
MPKISEFLGIIIMMFYDEHNPPHFHAKYQNYDIIVEIETGIIKGKFPPRATRLVLEWHEKHKEELQSNWLRATRGEELARIEGLE